MPPEFVVKALTYGVLGLCAVILVLTWRVLQAEQRREGAPRKGILRFATAFMVFCAFLAGLSAYVQITQASSERAVAVRLDPVLIKLDEINSLLCDKVFFEVERVKTAAVAHDTEQLEHLIRRLQRAASEAWSYSKTERELRPCLRAG